MVCANPAVNLAHQRYHPLLALGKAKASSRLPGFDDCGCREHAHMLTNAARMGELEPWIDENFVRSVWYNMGEQVNVKMIRDKFSG